MAIDQTRREIDLSLDALDKPCLHMLSLLSLLVALWKHGLIPLPAYAAGG